MKNYLKFIIAVFGVTMALCTSLSMSANRNDKDQDGPGPSGTCTLSMNVCGTTGDGNVISGTYNN
ncbi:hypothetical protein SGQ83_11565 [Flavobacterium sp. Fl-318]|uniref:Secreted protein n=1 Tax=Flavobacterium cupriresistens TaxID=2893885 RepID=A0ABU4RDP6_9FLAO|nr:MULTISPECIES: hypothetical protein [unclassified Flavobacterium]MDX6189988.1 hypothetical protein [Flavobacterium sp. Fl-318]UFH42813.1 hypothetical protein LNP23_01015 [Flavobacterium sp. F-323]